MPRREQDREAALGIARALGSRARAFRQELGWTQELASEKLGMSPEAYARIERGQSLPSFPTFLRLCEVFDTTPDAILLASSRSKGKAAPHDPDAADRRRLCTLIADLDPDALRAVEGVVRVLRRQSAT